MKRAEKAERIRSLLEETYPEVAPFLDYRDPYTLLVAVVLSAQTTDKKVNQVTPTLFARADTPEAMAKLTPEEVLGIIREIGLAPGKSRALVGLSKILVEEHGGKVPVSFEALEALPGVGHKTASVVMAQAFDVPAFPVDTHVHRLAARWGLSSGRSVEETERDLCRLWPRDAWIGMHLRIIRFGREHCPARGHDLEACPVCGWAASKARIAEERSRGGAPRRKKA